MGLRIFRALVGVFGLIMLRASFQPGFEYLIAGDGASLAPFAWRLLTGLLALVVFFQLRSRINEWYLSTGAPSAPLRAIWNL